MHTQHTYSFSFLFSPPAIENQAKPQENQIEGLRWWNTTSKLHFQYRDFEVSRNVLFLSYPSSKISVNKSTLPRGPVPGNQGIWLVSGTLALSVSSGRIPASQKWDYSGWRRTEPLTSHKGHQPTHFQQRWFWVGTSKVYGAIIYVNKFIFSQTLRQRLQA